MSALYKQNEAALVVSYEVSRLIAQTRTPHTIGEKLILLSLEISVKRMLGDKEAQKIMSVSLSNNNVQRRGF